MAATITEQKGEFMRRVVTLALTSMLCLAVGSVARAEHKSIAVLRSEVESWTARLDSHTRRLYYEVRDEAEGDAEYAQLLLDTRELWRAARRTSDGAMDGVSATKLEREVRRVEEAFDAVEEQVSELRRERMVAPPVRKRVQHIEELVHVAHDRVHELIDQESSVQGAKGYRPPESLRREQEAERRAAEYADPPSIRVGPDGFYFDGRRFTIPLGR